MKTLDEVYKAKYLVKAEVEAYLRSNAGKNLGTHL